MADFECLSKVNMFGVVCDLTFDPLTKGQTEVTVDNFGRLFKVNMFTLLLFHLRFVTPCDHGDPIQMH